MARYAAGSRVIRLSRQCNARRLTLKGVVVANERLRTPLAVTASTLTNSYCDCLSDHLSPRPEVSFF